MIVTQLLLDQLIKVEQQCGLSQNSIVSLRSNCLIMVAKLDGVARIANSSLSGNVISKPASTETKSKNSSVIAA
ncbi:MAG: hypothetical protein KME06_05850 [Kastovskya adunca ATA6-11-RM4]|nr:hypothetical protein [Kastovskya adunca ATA6-11-RM4]